MKAPLSWLRSLVTLPEANVVAERLAMLGFPVEEIANPPLITGVVFGRITALTPHPNADRLQVCTIDIGAAQTLTIATAATNVAVDQVVPVAQIGAQLPELKIAPRKMRGIDSEGMLCSAAELGLPAAWFEDGILQCDRSFALGADVVASLGLAEPVLDVEVTTNRPDALSLLGLARELSVAFQAPLRELPQVIATDAALPALRIERRSSAVEAVALLSVTQLPSGKSPLLTRVRLAQAGIRPLGPLVDVTNYVMLELGRPLHFFDASALEDNAIIFRDAAEGETLRTLDDVERKLSPIALVAADGANVPIALAGVIGGAASGIGAMTTAAVLEIAQFQGARIRRSAAACNLRTEASARFEKGLPPRTLDAAIGRATYLLQQLGATVSAPARSEDTLPAAAVIALASATVTRILGIELDAATLTSALESLGCEVEAQAARETVGGGFLVKPPPWRNDLQIEADLVEEIARVHGYENLPLAIARVAPPTISSQAYLQERTLAQALQFAGYHEIITLALESAAVRERFAQLSAAPESPPVEIMNPLSEEQRFLRFSLLPAMLEILSRRQSELRERDLHFFEIGQIFGSANGAREIRSAIWCSARKSPATREAGWRAEYFYAAKARSERALMNVVGGPLRAQAATAPALHPGKCATIALHEKPIATIGAVDPRLLAMYELDAEVIIGFADLDALPPAAVVRYQAPSRFPSVHRDLAFILASTLPAQQVVDVISAAEPIASQVRIFDEYRDANIGESAKSLTVRFSLGRPDATLTDDDAEISVQRIIAAVKTELGGELRR